MLGIAADDLFADIGAPPARRPIWHSATGRAGRRRLTIGTRCWPHTLPPCARAQVPAVAGRKMADERNELNRPIREILPTLFRTAGDVPHDWNISNSTPYVRLGGLPTSIMNPLSALLDFPPTTRRSLSYADVLRERSVLLLGILRAPASFPSRDVHACPRAQPRPCPVRCPPRSIALKEALRPQSGSPSTRSRLYSFPLFSELALGPSGAHPV